MEDLGSVSGSLAEYAWRQARTLGIAAPPLDPLADANDPSLVAWVPTGLAAAAEAEGNALALGTLDLRKSSRSLALSLDDHLLYSGHDDGQVRCWDLVSGQLRWTVNAAAGSIIDHLAVAPDGQRLACGARDHAVRTLATEDGTLLLALEGHSRDIAGLAWSPDGQWLASLSEDGTVRMWAGTTGALRWSAEVGAVYFVCELAWSPDGQWLAVAPGRSRLTLLRAGDGQVVRAWTPAANVYSVSWSLDSQLLATGTGDGQVSLWDPLASGAAPLRAWQAHVHRVVQVAFSPDSRWLASVSDDGRSADALVVWEVATGEAMERFPLDNGARRLYTPTWAHSGAYLVFLDWESHGAWFYDQRHRAPQRSAQQVSVGSAWVPTGLTAAEEGALGILALRDSSECLALSLDDRLLYSGHPHGWVRCWDLISGELRWEVTFSEGRFIDRVAVAPEGQRLACGARDYIVRVLSVEDGALLLSLEGHSASIVGLAWSPEGQWLASLGMDGTVRVWDGMTGAPHWTTAVGTVSAFSTLVWSPDGQWLAVAPSTPQLTLLQAGDGQVVRQWTPTTNVNVRSVSWSPDNQLLASASADGQIRLWDPLVPSDVPIRAWQAHADEFVRVQFSPDGRWLASAADHEGLAVWEVATGEAVERFPSDNAGSLYGLTWAHSGAYLVFADWERQEALVVDQRHRLPAGVAGTPARRLAAAGVALGLEPTAALRATLAAGAAGGGALHVPGGERREAQQLVWAAGQLHRLGVEAPLSWIRNLLALTAGQPLPPPTLPAVGQPPRAASAAPGISTSTPAAGEGTGVGAGAGERGAGAGDGVGVGDGENNGALAEELGAVRSVLAGVVGLHWPVEARVGLVALLLHALPTLPPAGFSPPPRTRLGQVSQVLQAALTLGHPCPPQAPPLPLAPLLEAARQVGSPRLLTLLTILGPEAVAAEPGLPLRLLPRLGTLPVLGVDQRRLLGARARPETWVGPAAGDRAGMTPPPPQGSGRDPLAERGRTGGIERGGSGRTDWAALLPSQLALPGALRAFRYAQGELLFRARVVSEPPRLRPLVLLLDVSPGVFGPVEASTRLAAHLLAQATRAAGLPVTLVTPTPGGRALALEVREASDLVEIWTRRTLEPVAVERCLRLAGAVRASLAAGGGGAAEAEPSAVMVLLTHPWFGAEPDLLPATDTFLSAETLPSTQANVRILNERRDDTDIRRDDSGVGGVAGAGAGATYRAGVLGGVGAMLGGQPGEVLGGMPRGVARGARGGAPVGVEVGLRGLFVQYPGYAVRPALAGRCEHWVTVGAGETATLPSLLASLLA